MRMRMRSGKREVLGQLLAGAGGNYLILILLILYTCRSTSTKRENVFFFPTTAKSRRVPVEEPGWEPGALAGALASPERWLTWLT